MKHIYLPVLLTCFLLSACRKNYEDRIIGTWNLVDVDRRGIGGSISNQTFQDGTFTFREDGTMTYVTAAGAVYEGGWDIDREWSNGDCYTDENGSSQCNTQEWNELFISVTNLTSQHVKKERFNNIRFTSSNRFKAFIYSGFHTYVFIFRR